MLKRIVLAMILMLCAASFTVEAAPATKCKINQSTKEATAETFLKAMYVYQDADAIWSICTPTLQKQLIAKNGSEAKAKAAIKAIWGGFTKDQLDLIKQQVMNDKVRAEAIKAMLQSAGNAFVKINGKWYITAM